MRLVQCSNQDLIFKMISPQCVSVYMVAVTHFKITSKLGKRSMKHLYAARREVVPRERKRETSACV